MGMMQQRPLVEDIQNYAQNIVDTVREPLLILDATLAPAAAPATSTMQNGCELAGTCRISN